MSLRILAAEITLFNIFFRIVPGSTGVGHKHSQDKTAAETADKKSHNTGYSKNETYDYTIHNRAEETITIEPRKVIVVEGIMIFVDKTLCDEMNIRIFVDADADVRLCRRIRRDLLHI